MNETILPLLKARLGISTESRDPVLNVIIGGIVSECKNTHGIILEKDKQDHVLFVLDWATWKYKNPEDGVIPRSIRFRLNNLVIKKAGRADEPADMG